MTKRRDFTPLNFPKPDAPATQTLSRETTRTAPGIEGDLAALGRRNEGLDGKRYVASFACHVYEAGGSALGPPEFVTLSVTTDLTACPESVAQHAVKELARAVMRRYGRKPPQRRDDVAEREDRTL